METSPRSAATWREDRNRLARPNDPALMPIRGFRLIPGQSQPPFPRYGVLREATFLVYQPDGPEPHAVSLSLDGVSVLGRPREIRLLDGDRELCRWSVAPSDSRVHIGTPPISLAPGLHSWTFRADGEDRPTDRADRFDDTATPYSFQIQDLGFIRENP